MTNKERVTVSEPPSADDVDRIVGSEGPAAQVFTIHTHDGERRHPEVCLNVTEVADLFPAGILLGPNVARRPGVALTDHFTEPRRYVVSQGRWLPAITHPERGFPPVGGPTASSGSGPESRSSPSRRRARLGSFSLVVAGWVA